MVGVQRAIRCYISVVGRAPGAPRTHVATSLIASSAALQRQPTALRGVLACRLYDVQCACYRWPACKGKSYVDPHALQQVSSSRDGDGLGTHPPPHAEQNTCGEPPRCHMLPHTANFDLAATHCRTPASRCHLAAIFCHILPSTCHILPHNAPYDLPAT